MKKITLSLLFGLFVAFSFAQLTEDFTTGVPPTGWLIEGQSANWSAYNGTSGLGTAPQAHIHWEPQFNGTSRLISPTVDLTGTTTVVLNFNHLYDYYGGAFSYGVATRSGGGTWNVVWTANNVTVMENRAIAISNADVGQSDFQFCFFFTGNSYNINDILIDDVDLSIPPAVDVEMLPLTMLPFAISEGDVNIDCKFKNHGTTTVTSLDVNYQIDSDAIVTQSLTGLNLGLTDSYNYTFPTPWAATIGAYNINVWVSNINGNGDDNDTTNDSKNMNFSVASQTTQNKPLFELFTSSSCGPCAGFNGSVFNPFMAQHDDISVIKYQSNGPSPGDPYYTPEVGVRASYYGQNGVPQLYVGAIDYATPGYVPTEAQVNQGYNVELPKLAAFASINPSFSVDGNVITVDADITPYLSGDFKVYVVVIEKTTTGNTGSNGETSFENVMMKMLPDALGETVSFIDGTVHSIHHEFDMSSTFVEEMNDLAVVIFVQDDKSKYVFQSGIEKTASVANIKDSIFTSVNIYPNPSKGIIYINTNKQLNFEITDMLGKVVLSEPSISNIDKIDISNLNSGVYFIKISDGLINGVKKIVLKK